MDKRRVVGVGREERVWSSGRDREEESHVQLKDVAFYPAESLSFLKSGDGRYSGVCGVGNSGSSLWWRHWRQKAIWWEFVRSRWQRFENREERLSAPENECWLEKHRSMSQELSCNHLVWYVIFFLSPTVFSFWTQTVPSTLRGTCIPAYLLNDYIAHTSDVFKNSVF